MPAKITTLPATAGGGTEEDLARPNSAVIMTGWYGGKPRSSV